MILAFESLMEQRTGCSQLHDVVLRCLYNDLKPKIHELDSLIIQHAHLLNGVDITVQGSRHDDLFLLKVMTSTCGSICRSGQYVVMNGMFFAAAGGIG